MKKIKVLIFSLVFLSISSLATAGQETGPYIGGSLGYTMIHFERANWDDSDNDLGYKVFAGYNFGLIPFLDLAIEGSYVDFGEASRDLMPPNPWGTNLEVGITAWDAFGLACFNVGPVGIFGKVGQVWWDSKANVMTLAYEKSSNDLALGVGVRFQVGSATIRAEYEYFDINIIDVNFFSVGVSWTF